MNRDMKQDTFYFFTAKGRTTGGQWGEDPLNIFIDPQL